jgi:thiamine-monophosphate kinase
LSTPVSGSTAPLAAVGERGLIALIRERFPASPDLLPVGIGDDAAVAVPARGALEVLTTDALVEGIHFDLGFSAPADVGYKALAVNVSDIAAMGGTPRLALLSLLLPARLRLADFEALLDGVAAMAREAGVTVAGGNITKSPGPLVLDVTVLGAVRPRKFLTRAGGRPGDALYVSGQVGAAAAGLGWLQNRGAAEGRTPDAEGLAACVERHRRPEPRLRLGSVLGRTRAASACMDLSDGLADAVSQLAAASGTGARIDAESLPIPDAVLRWFAGQGVDPVRAAIGGSDDYELMFSVPARRRGRLKTVLQQTRGLAVTRIGELTAVPSIVLMRNGAAEPLPEGFAHF